MEDSPDKIWCEIDVKVMRHGGRKVDTQLKWCVDWNCVGELTLYYVFPFQTLVLTVLKDTSSERRPKSPTTFSSRCGWVTVDHFILWVPLFENPPANPWTALRLQISYFVLVSWGFQSWARTRCNDLRSRLKHREVAAWHDAREQVLECLCHSGNE